MDKTIGIIGMAGEGRTTLAKAIIEKLHMGDPGLPIIGIPSEPLPMIGSQQHDPLTMELTRLPELPEFNYIDDKDVRNEQKHMESCLKGKKKRKRKKKNRR